MSYIILVNKGIKNAYKLYFNDVDVFVWAITV